MGAVNIKTEGNPLKKAKYVRVSDGRKKSTFCAVCVAKGKVERKDKIK